MSRSKLAPVLFALLVAACGGDDDPPADNPTTDAEADATETSVAPDTGGGVDSATPDTTPDTSTDDTSTGETGDDTGASDGGGDTSTTDGATDTATSDGADGAADACTPTTESCNGLNDDCDDKTDEGCPATVGIGGGETGLTGFGGVGSATPSTDACAAGSAIVGFNVVVNSGLRQIQAICAPLQLVETTTATPYTYSTSTGTEVALPNRGTSTGTTASTKCPAGQFVVGLRTVFANASGVNQFGLACAPLNVTGAIGSFTLSRGTVSNQTAVGTSGGGSPQEATCAGSNVVNRMNYVVNERVAYLELGCKAPTITLK
jgi:hypothetical protein